MYCVMEMLRFSDVLTAWNGTPMKVDREPRGFLPVFETREEAEEYANDPRNIRECYIQEHTK